MTTLRVAESEKNGRLEPGRNLMWRWRHMRVGLPAALLLFVAAVVVLIVWTGLGMAATDLLGDDAVGQVDRGLSRWFARNRTDDLNTLTQVLSYLSETITVVVVGAIAFVAARMIWKRWRESLFLLAALTGEVTIFLALTILIDRNRPRVPRLDIAPPTSSFPSGHTAAAVVLYGALAILASDRARSAALIIAARVFAVLAPVLVGTARLYRGMHFLTDVIAGALLGVAWLLITARGVRLGVIHRALHESQQPPERPTPGNETGSQ